MEMENSLKQLDEYLEKIGRSGLVSEEQDDVSAVEQQPGVTAENDLIEKSSDTAIEEKSSKIEDNEQSSSLVRNNEKSSTFTRDFTPSMHNSIDPFTDSYNSSVIVNDPYLHFDKETEETSESDFIENVKTESIQFEESEQAVNELAEIGLSEESLQEFALSGPQPAVTETGNSAMAENADLENGVTSTLKVHPVSLKKSTRPYEKPVTTREPKGQVTTLLDLSSIGELKRLWVKSEKAVKKVNTPIPKQVDRKCSLSMTSKNSNLKSKETAEIRVKQNMKISAKPTVKVTSEELNEVSDLEVDGFSSGKKRTTSVCTKPCSVKLIRVEELPMFENINIDLSVPKSSTVIKFEESDQMMVPEKSKRKDLYKKSDKVNQNVKSFFAKSVKKISAFSNGKQLSQKAKDKKQKIITPKAITATVRKHENKPKKTDQHGTKLNSTDGKVIGTSETEISPQGDEMLTNSEAELDINGDIEDSANIKDEKYGDDDNDDVYFPSDDEKDDDYHPKKKAKKSKAKKSNSTNRAKVIFSVKQDDKDLTAEVKVKAASKKLKGTRIGRPPVFGHFECKFCDFTANEKNLIDKHHFKSHRTVLNCKECDKKFRTVNGLLEHNAYKHDGGKPFKCDHEGCPYASKNTVDLERHKAKHDPELKHVCDICGWRTRWQRNIKHHFALKHCDERNYKCTICEFAAKRPYDLKEHMYRHTDEKPIQCLTCGFRVKTNFELRSHMLVHSNLKPFKCTFPGCSSATKTKSDLSKHMRVHQTERPFKCHICSKGYKDQNSLNKHLTGIHVAERKFKCDICGKTFKNRYALKKHVYLHSGYKPYECSVCNWKFSSKNNMEKHMVTHDTNERPFPCPLCPYSAKVPDHLFAHIGSYHGDKYAYFCELCNKPFKRYMQLKLHHERMHTKKEVESLKKSPMVDLALLKMEMKLELEEVEAGKKRRRKSRSKSQTLSDSDIKEEPIDEDYGDTVRGPDVEEDFDDVRLNEDTGEIEVVKRKKLNTAKQDDSRSSHLSDDVSINVRKNSDVENFDKDEVEIEFEKYEKRTENSTTENPNDIQFVEINEVEENVMRDTGIEEEEKKKDNILIAKGDLSTVALYNNFRIPLATRGFKFNYEKTGKKPLKAWFMDTSLMDRQTAEKHQKHRRRLGLLPAIPRGHPPKGYKRLKRFVDQRKRQLAENIKKAKFVKDLGLVSKRNLSRSKRFQGKYTEFETVDGEVLSVSEVQQRLPKVKIPKTEIVIKEIPKKSPSSKTKNVTNKGKGKTNSSSSRKQKTSDETKEICKSKTAAKSKSKKKPATKTTKSKTPKLLLSTEKKKQKKQKLTNVKIRKPIFLEETREVTSTNANERNSFEALESILTEFNHSGSAMTESENMQIDKIAVQQQTLKKGNKKAKSGTVPKSKLKNLKKPVEKNQVKPKYNKKYVPVKKPVKRKNNDGEKEAKKLKIADVVSDPSSTSKKKNPETKLSNSKQKSAKKKLLKVKMSQDFGKSVTNKWVKHHVQEEQDTGVYPASVHVPVQNTQLVMVYPVNVMQTAGVATSSETGDHPGVFVTMNGNYSAVTGSASHIERVEFKRDLNDALTDSFNEIPDSENQVYRGENSDKELMQQEYTETVLVKQEPELSFYSSFAQDSTAV
ncbi:uncharacterized protein LOC123549704 [Mercenaria mercenaria]|uniref:uncharacterized protein LOC123549704 n=1 Tax=Mercenaria mercenaria TaxID=6596 RepID=UPI00234E87A9|nr:uncharacterized protein LOC123549704 [Mercenaria mercenaria]